MLVENMEREKMHSEIFWAQVEKSWPEVVVVNKKEIDFDEKVEVCVVLCPLYSPGSLRESTLLPPPATVEGSRVANKVNAYKSVLQAMDGYIKALGGQMHLNVVFANKGVLFAGQAGTMEMESLTNHKEVYLNTFYEFCRVNKMGMEFTDYNDWNVDFPTFVDPGEEIPEDIADLIGKKNSLESKMIAQLSGYFGKEIVDNKKNRHTIKRILNMDGLGYDAAFWLIAGYLAFDGKMADIVGKNGIYISAERFEPLFGTAKLTENLKELTRIQIKA